MREYDDFAGDEEEVEYYAVRPNKTKIKKEINALFAMGETFSALTAEQLASLQLPENIHQAVREVAGMPLTGARKRLLKYIAGQLHKIDVEPFKEKLALIQNVSVHSVREHHQVEKWRDRLINQGNEALTELINQQPEADLQRIRSLLRNLNKEHQIGASPKSSRLLYRYLKDLFQFNDGEASQADVDNIDED
ncbi:MAG: DUF615 domain-containing protein [Gammaproteobacteria bacterium]|nr:DUF615 domain-containing protein [Gammaproteobacteria bacterium]